MGYNLDIILCIELTGYMQMFLDEFKTRITNFLPDLQSALYNSPKGCFVKGIRVKIIGFRDFNEDAYGAFVESQFYNLTNPSSSDYDDFKSFVSTLEAHGGWYSGKTNSLEALSLALKSNWIQRQPTRLQRHVTVMITGSIPYKFEEANRKSINYPDTACSSFNELTEIWMPSSNMSSRDNKRELSRSGNRLVIFGSKVYPWLEVFDSWDKVAYQLISDSYFPGDMYNQYYIPYDDIIQSIAFSI